MEGEIGNIVTTAFQHIWKLRTQELVGRVTRNEWNSQGNFPPQYKWNVQQSRTKREDWTEDKVELENVTVREVEKEAIRQEKPWNI